MDGAYKEWWYKDKMMGVSKNGYFCLFQPYILTINYRCLEYLLLIFGPIRPKTRFSQSFISFSSVFVFYITWFDFFKAFLFSTSLDLTFLKPYKSLKRNCDFQGWACTWRHYFFFFIFYNLSLLGFSYFHFIFHHLNSSMECFQNMKSKV